MFYGSNPSRKDKSRWVISNAAETTKVPSLGPPLLMVTPSGQHHRGGHLPRGIVAAIGERILFGCGIATAWLAGLPRRAGRRLHAATDAEARQWDWQVTERRGGLVHQYRDARFDALRHDPSLRRDELRDDIQPPPAGCPRGGDV